MRVVVLGSTGLLGRAITLELLSRGHEVVGVTLDGARAAEQPSSMPTQALDVIRAHDTQLDLVLHGADAVVYALGPDDRERPPAPAATYFRTQLVEPTVRVARAAARQDLARMVILGSYFSHFDKLNPQWQLARRHPYIHAREQQAAGAAAALTGRGALNVMQIPFVFGTYPDLEPLWKKVFYDLIRRSPVPTTLSGTNGATTHLDVARAAAAILDGQVPPGAHPVATDNLTYRRLTELVLEELGRSSAHIRTLPTSVVTAGLRTEGLWLKVRGLDSGLNPATLATDLLTRDLSLDVTQSCARFGLTPAPVDPWVRETVRVSYPDLTARHGGRTS